MKRLVAESVHSDSFGEALTRLNNESIGGLIFSTEQSVSLDGQGYTALDADDLKFMRDKPREASFEYGMASRLSLPGAQGKVGLYHAGDDMVSGWYLPSGAAPSTHIVKMPEGASPNQTINEALCLETARLCGFDVPDWSLIAVDDSEPLIAVERFDRLIPNNPDDIDGLPVPMRLHQEDFCQASLLMPDMKYEPTAGNYLGRCATVIARSSSNPFGDRMYFLQTIMFDYLVGNCDNHLKNHAILWDASWSEKEVSPLYDVVCTTIYPQIYLEMGVSLCPSRRITDVTPSDIVSSCRSMHVSPKMGIGLYRELWDGFPSALHEAKTRISDMGYPQVGVIADHIEREFASKVKPESLSAA